MVRLLKTRALGKHIPLLVLLALMPVVMERMAQVDWGGVGQALRSTALPQWGLALLATLISFCAIARHEAVAQTLLGLHGRAGHSGAAAIAISQTTGFGPMVGSLVRWRLRPDLGAVGAAKLTSVVTLSFLGGLAVLGAAAVLISPMPLPGQGIAALIGGAALAVLALSLWSPRILRGRIPPLRTLLALLALTALDALTAAFALYAVLPDAAGVTFTQLLPVFLLALAAGQLSGAPGGVGAFELTLLALLPMAPEAALLGGVLAWRAIYYMLPAMAGAGLWLRGQAHPGYPGWSLSAAQGIGAQGRARLHNAPQAEAQLFHQGPFQLLRNTADQAGWIAARSGQSLILLGDPLGGRSGAALRLARCAASAHGRAPVHYKCSERVAAQARKQGYRVLPIAAEAVLNPVGFTTQGARFRQLRRKLRKAQTEGVTCGPASAPPRERLAQIARGWALARGGELGFSTGRFDPQALARQQVFLAWHADRVIGFASFHSNAREWVLDLMRLEPDAPDGTMHMLIATALEAGAARGLTRLSLAAIPRDPQAFAAPLRPLARHLATGRAGLRQFKSAFDPQWEPRYIAAPGWGAMGLGLWDLWREITDPRGQAAPAAADNPIAPAPGSWHPSGDVSVRPVAVPATGRICYDRRADPPV